MKKLLLISGLLFSSLCMQTIDRLDYIEIITRDKAQATPENLATVLIDIANQVEDIAKRQALMQNAISVFDILGCDLKNTYNIFSQKTGLTKLGLKNDEKYEMHRPLISLVLLNFEAQKLNESINSGPNKWLAVGLAIAALYGGFYGLKACFNCMWK